VLQVLLPEGHSVKEWEPFYFGVLGTVPGLICGWSAASLAAKRS
jgi:hypothetical protein